MKKFSYIFFLTGLLLFLSACEKGFDSVNNDPNNPSTVPTAYLLTSAQRSVVTELMGRNSDWGIDVTPRRYMQHWSATLYTETDRYQEIREDFSTFYSGGLQDLTEIIRLNTDETTKYEAAKSGPNENQIAIARILKAWVFQNITDIWGDVPYSEALQGDTNYSPQYDTQESIYADLIKELDESTDQFVDGDISGDIIFNGSIDKWKLFAQSLKLRLGIRMSKVAPALAKTAVQEAISKGVFTSNDDNALYLYLTAAPNNNPWQQQYDYGAPEFAITTTMIGKLTSLSDPRLAIYANPAENSGKFVGMPYGVTAAVAGSYGASNVSLPGDKVRQATSPAILLTYSEVLFNKAEAAARGWINEDAEALYKSAITASMQYWGVTDSAITSYLAQPAIAFNKITFQKSIGEQKWLALYMQGVETWSEWRRLGYPELVVAPDAVQNRAIPRRRGYPQSESSLNQTNYDAAVARQGPDLMDIRIWWDKE
ncbi:SusD/RagB family nutrient-binding outer membrane lipoprotein [Cytophagaceae bacterium YF14B1]|uniref:SusD/RagB family nutrient-binding outer membrane lipoprotein n=1 Tax=Xanthocytophaga flava TaxID=3048013 RepID=A0AAE3QQB3_9BACT|nr:SusD/RagB family nutrient-binding outer membrane lipoprotein [Xanthocytophaga flavus]MDJ1483522.1 SusD/RagB family nutrient-binding outer membrane lipoprotein [Xanthocytophaga flavus]